MLNRKNIQTGIIIILLLTTIVFGLAWLWKSNSSKKEVREIKREIKAIEKSKDSTDKAYKKLKFERNVLDARVSILKADNFSLSEENERLKKDYNKSKKKLKDYIAKIPTESRDSALIIKIISVVETCDSTIEGLETQVSVQDNIIKEQDSVIVNLDKQIINRELYAVMTNKQLLLSEDIINNQKLQIRKLKTRNIIIGTTGGAVAAGILAGLIYSIIK